MITPSWTGVAEPIMPGLGSARWDCPELASDAPVAPHDRAGARTRGAARRSVPLPTRCRSAHGIEQFFQFGPDAAGVRRDRKRTRLNSSHVKISYAVFCLKKKRTT